MIADMGAHYFDFAQWVHGANICLRLGRPVRWNAETERFVDDAQANRMLQRAMRPPWRV